MEEKNEIIMRAFKELRHFVKQNQQFVTNSEMELLSTKLSEVHVQISYMRKRQNQTDKKIENIWKSIDTKMKILFWQVISIKAEGLRVFCFFKIMLTYKLVYANIRCEQNTIIFAKGVYHANKSFYERGKRRASL